MKTTLVLFFSFFCLLTASAQSKTPSAAAPEPDKSKEILQVEAACGQCKFGLAGNGCDLAVRTQGKAYFVDGTDIDSHGDAHAADGFCQAIRKANIQGEVVGNRFKVTYFQLVPESAAPKKN